MPKMPPPLSCASSKERTRPVNRSGLRLLNAHTTSGIVIYQKHGLANYMATGYMGLTNPGRGTGSTPTNFSLIHMPKRFQVSYIGTTVFLVISSGTRKGI